MKHLLALAAFFVLLSASVTAAEQAAPDAGALSPGVVHEYNAELEEVMRRLESAVDAGTRELVERQPDDKSAGDVALVIGIFHHIGLFHGVDLPKAREFMEMAYERGVPEAGVTLGELHLGFAIPGAESADRDFDKAMSYLNEAAAADSVDALRMLGLLYTDGVEGLEPDPEKAERYFLAAARQGDPESLARLEPVFERARAWENEHPGEKSDIPTSAEEAVDPESAKVAEARNEEISRVAQMVQTESEKWADALIAEELEAGN